MVTIREVANKAGVSKATVSRVINDYPGISEMTRRKVRQVVCDLGYVPNPIAQEMVRYRVQGVLNRCLSQEECSS
jgi:LacI family transcriptional regulator